MNACAFPDGVLHDHGNSHCHEASYNAGRRDALTSAGSIELTFQRYPFAGGGTIIEAPDDFPPVYANDDGSVEIGDSPKVPASEAIAWLRAVANAIEAREDAR